MAVPVVPGLAFAPVRVGLEAAISVLCIRFVSFLDILGASIAYAAVRFDAGPSAAMGARVGATTGGCRTLMVAPALFMPN